VPVGAALHIRRFFAEFAQKTESKICIPDFPSAFLEPTTHRKTPLLSRIHSVTIHIIKNSLSVLLFFFLNVV